MTQNNWGQDYPPHNFGRDLTSGHDFGRELGGTNFGRDYADPDFGRDIDPPLAWYSTRVLATRPANLLAYWRLSEPFGTVAADASGNGRTGAYVGVDLQQSGIGDGLTCPRFDGVNDYVHLYSASLAAAFPTQEGTTGGWLKVQTPDATLRRIIQYQVNASNRVTISRTAGSNTIAFAYTAGGVSKGGSIANAAATSDWIHAALTWSVANNQVRSYLNGVLVDTATGLGVWAGSLTSNVCLLGASTMTPAQVWHGNLAHWALWNAPLTALEIAYLGRR